MLLLANNAVSRLSTSLTASATSLSITAGDGAKFPALSGGDWYPLTLIKSDGTYEILRATVRSGDVFTIARAQEGTSALSFLPGDRVELRLTAAALATLFGGSGAFPQFGGLELSSAAPYVDFHYQNSGADYTSRIIAAGAATLQVLSGSGGLQATFRQGGMDVNGDMVAYANAIAKGGIVEIGDSSPAGTSMQVRYDGTLVKKLANQGYGASETIFTTANFNPGSKVNADAISFAGFASNDPSAPYFRRASDNVVYYLQRALNFNPVQQGTGVGQGANAIKIGYDGSQPRITVDNSDFGQLITTGNYINVLMPLLGAQGAGGIGTYAFAYTGVNATPGTAVAGGNLLFGNASGQGGVTLPGTWRSMGDASAGQRTLFLRIN